MRILNKIAFAALVVMLVATVQPVFAACVGTSVIGTAASGTVKSGIWNPAVFTPGYYAGSLPFDYVPPWTPDFEVSFWGLTTGDVTVGLGDDIGSFDVGAGAYYTSYLAYIYAGEIATGFGVSPNIDGCIGNDPTLCNCVLLTDQANGEGYFASLADQVSATLNTDLDQPGPDPAGNAAGHIPMAPMGPAGITNTVRQLNLDVAITASFGFNPAGNFPKEGCDCEPTQWVPYYTTVSRGGPAPVDRKSGWTAGGNPVALGSDATFTVPCGASNVDVYVAGAYRWETGFETAVVGANSTRVECGPDIANPSDTVIQSVTPQRTRPTQKQGKSRR